MGDSPGDAAYRQRALELAHDAAGPLRPSKTDFERCVSSVVLTAREATQVCYDVEHREARLLSAPAYGSKPRDCVPLPDAPTDLWNVDAAALERSTSVTATCPECEGSTRIVCAGCTGETRIRCDECHGSGRVQGARGPKNCPRCRSKGTVRCPECRAGKQPCSLCDKVGRVEACWTIGSSTVSRTREDDPHGLLDDGAAALLEDQPVDPQDLPSRLQPVIDDRCERLLACRMQRFARPEAVVSYELGTGKGFARVVGADPQIVDADWTPFQRRAALTKFGTVLVALCFLVATVTYVARHRWFFNEGPWEVLLLLSVAGCVAARFTLLAGTLGKSFLQAPLGLISTVALTAAGLMFSTVWLTHNPSAARAAALFDAGHIEAAGLEASASLDFGDNRDVAETVLDGVHVANSLGKQDLESLDRALAEPWFSPDSRKLVEQAMRDRLHQRLATARSQRNSAALAALVPRVTAHLPAELPAITRDVRTYEVEDALGRRDWSSAEDALRVLELLAGAPKYRSALIAGVSDDLQATLDKAGSAPTPEGSVHELQRALALAHQVDRLRSDSARPATPAVETRLHAAQKKLDRHLARQRRIAEANALRERRRIARETRQEEARERREARRQREAAQQRTRALRRAPACAVQCCDGTCSPTCQYVHRGCCSHHGGVCG